MVQVLQRILSSQGSQYVHTNYLDVEVFWRAEHPAQVCGLRLFFNKPLALSMIPLDWG